MASSVDRQSKGGVNFRHTTRRCFSVWLLEVREGFSLSIGEDSKEGADAGIAGERGDLNPPRLLAQSCVENDVPANVERRMRCAQSEPVEALQSPRTRRCATSPRTWFAINTAVNDQALALVKKLKVKPQDNITRKALVKQADAKQV